MYQAIITPIMNIRPHPNADRLNIGLACNEQVVISKDITEKTLGFFCPCDGQLSHEFCRENNLYSHKELNKDPEKAGFFGNNRRVKAQKFRGEISDGFWVPLDTLAFTGDISTLKEGDQFTELNGTPICNKYYTPATMRGMGGGPNKQKTKQKNLFKVPYFKEHWDTAHLLRCVGQIPSGAILSITQKCHGTSGRTGRALRIKELNRFQKLWNKTIGRLGPQFSDRDWVHVTGTRRVVLDPKTTEDKGFYSGKQFRTILHDKIRSIGLRQGETLYYEIIGYDDSGAAIMGSSTLDKELAKKVGIDKKDYEAFVAQYGETIVYSYGCQPGEYKLLVYRITQTSDDGHAVELSYNQVISRCRELGLEYVPVLVEPFIYDGDRDKLITLCQQLAEGTDVIDKRHIREGVVVRVEAIGIDTNYKLKGFWFRLLEGLVKEQETYVDAEEVS